MRNNAIKYTFILLLQRVIGIAFYFVSAGTVINIRGIVNVSLYFIISLVAIVLMLSGHQETLSERGRKHDNTKGWDKIILPVYILLSYFGIYIAAGLGYRFHLKILPVGCFCAGIILYLLSAIFTVWPVLENKHFEETSRIQNNREQTVIKTGPYGIIRHPGYAGIVIWALASYLMFGTPAVGVVSSIIMVIIWIRTFLEDNMLKNELPGYLEYSQTVRYRLIPFVW